MPEEACVKNNPSRTLGRAEPCAISHSSSPALFAVLVPEARFSGLWCFLVFALGAAATHELLVLASDVVSVNSH
jgi:hypothetical protein